MTAIPYNERRVGALKRFALTQTVLVILGHVWFGFEVSYALPLVAVGTAYAVQLLLGVLQAKAQDKPAWFLQSVGNLTLYLLPAHVAGLTVSLFLYPGDRLWPIVFASTLAIASKHIFTLPRYENGERVGSRHIFNPANFALLICLVGFPDVSILLPYSFSSMTGDVVDIALPVVFFVLGSLLTLGYTKKWPLIIAWLGAFVLQAGVRALFLDINFWAAVAPATGVVAILFTFYMVPDPATSPEKTGEQIAFGATIGLSYGVLMAFNVLFGLFWALVGTCLAYSLYKLYSETRTRSSSASRDDTSAGTEEPSLRAAS